MRRILALLLLGLLAPAGVLVPAGAQSGHWRTPASPAASDDQTASEVPITDAGDLFPAPIADVEAALATLRTLAPRAYATDGDLPAECGPEESWALVWASETYGEGPGLFVCPEAEGAWVPLTASGGGNVEDGATACAAGDVPTSQGDTTLACAPPVTAAGLDALDAIQYAEGQFGAIQLTAGTTATGVLSLSPAIAGLAASGPSAAISLQATDDSAPYNVTLALGGGTAAATLNNSDIVTAAYSGTIAADTSGNAATATALAANGANCSAGSAPLGVDASGAAESCTDYAEAGAITSSGLTMATARLLGRSTASTGAVEEITVGPGLTLAAGELSAAGGGIGGSTGGTDDAPLCADGTGGATLQACNTSATFPASVTIPNTSLFRIGGGANEPAIGRTQSFEAVVTDSAGTGIRRLYAYEFYASSNPGGTGDIYRFSQGALTILSASSLNWDISGSGATGHVSIGVSGGKPVLRLPPTDSPPTCDDAMRGGSYFDDSLGEHCACRGATGAASWQQMDGGGGC